MSIKGFNIGGTTYKVDYPELDNLPQINGNDLVGNLDAEDLGLDQVYWAGYRWATNAEIEAALDDGKIVLCRVPNPLALLDPPVVCQLTQRNSATNHRFAAITTGAEILLYVAYCINNSWTSGVFKLATDASVPDPNPNPAAPLGEASAGTSNTYSRGDHVHAMPSAEDVGAIRDPDTKSNGQVLTYNGYSWVARTPSGGGLSQEAKSALMDCFAHVAWVDANGQTYYNALASALGLRTLTSISAVYTQSGTVYSTDSLDSLKADLVVTATYSDSSTEVIAASGYTLSGTLAEGISTITVSCGGKTDTFDVLVSADNILHSWDFTQSLTDSVTGVDAVLGKKAGASPMPTRSSEGISITKDDQWISLGEIYTPDITIEIDFGTMSRQGTKNSRLLMIGNVASGGLGTGFIYRSTNTWNWYVGGAWDTAISATTDANYFSGKTLKAVIDANGKMAVYANDELLGTSTKAFLESAGKTVQIGSDPGTGTYTSYCNMVVRAVRVLRNEV